MISAVDNNNVQQWTTIRDASCISDAVFACYMLCPMCFAHPVFSLYDGPLANDHVFSSPGATLYIANGSLIPMHPILSPLFPSSSLPGGAYYNCRNVMMKVWTGPRSRCWGECSWRESRARLRDLPSPLPPSCSCCIPTSTRGSNKLLIQLIFYRKLFFGMTI